MSRKHFNDLANTVKELRTVYGDKIPAAALVDSLSAFCRRHNGNFNYARFARACEAHQVAKRQAA